MTRNASMAAPLGAPHGHPMCRLRRAAASATGWGAGLLIACSDPGPATPDTAEDTGEPPPCHSQQAAIEVAPPEGDFGDALDGASLWCGIPPQGGAPYTPFRVRLEGPIDFAEGAMIEMSAVDLADGTELALTSLALGLTCANVGENDGLWVGAEAHMRYDGFALDDLEGRDALVSVRAWPIAGGDPQVMLSWDVALVTGE